MVAFPLQPCCLWAHFQRFECGDAAGEEPSREWVYSSVKNGKGIENAERTLKG